MFQELKLTTSADKLEIILEAINDLAKIKEEELMLRIGGKQTFIYAAEKIGEVLSLIKYYTFDSQYLFQHLPENFPDSDFVIFLPKNFYKQFKIYKRSKEEIKLKILIQDQHNTIFKITAWDGKVRNNYTSGEHSTAENVQFSAIDDMRNSEDSIIEFSLNKEDYKDLKELSSVRTEDKRIFISFKKGSIFIEEQGTYSLKVGTYEDMEESSFCYNKDFFMSLPVSEEWKITMFTTMLFMDFGNGSILLTREI